MYRLIGQGLPVAKILGKLRFDVRDLDAWIERAKRTVVGAPAPARGHIPVEIRRTRLAPLAPRRSRNGDSSVTAVAQPFAGAGRRTRRPDRVSVAPSLGEAS
jgi:hypothetical protein